MEIKKVRTLKEITKTRFDYAINAPTMDISRLKGNLKIGDYLGNMVIINTYKFKLKIKLLIKCNLCGKFYDVEKRVLSDKFYTGRACSCGVAAYNESLKKLFFTKFKQDQYHRDFCTSCNSYRPSKYFNTTSRYCALCSFIKGNDIKIGKSFHDIMEAWDESLGMEKGVCRLPILSGNSRKGYDIVGFSLVDELLYGDLSSILWVSGGQRYVKATMSRDNLRRINKDSICYYPESKWIHLHRVVLGLSCSAKELVADHISGDRRDNRRSNLREATVAQNSFNSLKNTKSTSKYKGVYFSLQKAKWKAKFYIKGKYYTKIAECEEDAALAYDSLVRKHRPSDFNRYNFPREGELSAIARSTPNDID